MINLTSIKERMAYFIDSQGIKISQFYAESGVSYGILSQKSKITEDNIVRFLTKYSAVNAEWLILGKGEMLKTASPAEPLKSEVIYKSDPRDIELIETQRKLIHSLESRLHEVEKRGGKSKGISGLHSAPTVSSHSTDYLGNETK